jgi:hypothetical protein
MASIFLGAGFLVFTAIDNAAIRRRKMVNFEQ